MSRSPWAAILIGSTVGGLIPLIWGAGFFSFSSMLFSAVGAIVGIWVAYQVH
ncbi:hypothetical protein KW798_00890 [Candidatus Parcubacteria bacterium]|nr:hypothetical protein [Candidatus Parcubacteria bacterium]